MLRIDPSLDLDELRKQFHFEIVSEQEDGFVIVASEDVDLEDFQQKLTARTAVNDKLSSLLSKTRTMPVIDPNKDEPPTLPAFSSPAADGSSFAGIRYGIHRTTNQHARRLFS